MRLNDAQSVRTENQEASVTVPSLPRDIAGGHIQVVSTTHVNIGGFDVYLLPRGDALILAPGRHGTPDSERISVVLQDAQGGLRSFLDGAAIEAGRGYGTVSIGSDTLAHLVGQRAVTIEDLVPPNAVSVGFGAYEIQVPSRNGFDEYKIRYSPSWTYSVTAGGREGRN